MKRLLIIDDEADIREVLVTSLELTTEWKLETAASGREGIALAVDTRPDAIVLDFMMPEMDGPTTAAQLREHAATATIPIVLLTAKAQVADRDRLLNGVVNGILTKPFDPLTIADEIRLTLGWTE